MSDSPDFQIKGIFYSIGIHAMILLSYLALTYQPEYQSMDFDLSGPEMGFHQANKTFKKKLAITDMEKVVPETNISNEIPDNENLVSAEDNESESSEINNAKDLAYQSDAIAPRPLTRLQKIYPEKARRLEVEATAYLSIIIGTEGKVLSIEVIGVKLGKNISPEMDKSLKDEFITASKSILQNARFSSAKIKGKSVPVKMDIPLNFTLN